MESEQKHQRERREVIRSFGHSQSAPAEGDLRSTHGLGDGHKLLTGILPVEVTRHPRESPVLTLQRERRQASKKTDKMLRDARKARENWVREYRRWKEKRLAAERTK